MITTHVLESMNEVITNNYSNDHKAIDIVPSDKSEPNIISINNGTVETVVNDIKGTNHKSKGLDTYGNYVKIKQDNGKTALYAHMKYNSIKVNKGEYIKKGEVIGTIGETGNAYGKHLHLEIQNKDNIKENPIVTLKENSTSSTKNNNQKNVQKNITNIQTNTSKNKNHTNPTSNNNYLSAKEYHHGSIVDALKAIGINSSYNYRKKLAIKNGITNYKGSYFQNIKMLNLLKQGKLKKV